MNKKINKKVNVYKITKIVIMMVTLCLCWPVSEAFAETPIVVTAGVPVDPTTLDAAQSTDGSGAIYTYNIFDTLVSINPQTSAIEPCLALSWEIKDNGKMWLFKLRQNVKFQDGTNFNADAVVFSFQRQMDKNFPYRYYDFILFREIFPTLKEVKKIDDFTVAFYLTQPFYPFLRSLTSSCGIIVSPAAAKKYGKDFFAHPVGTGPFLLKSWQKGKRLILAKNPFYWREKPFIDEFNALIEPNMFTLYRMFNQQEIDINFKLSISRAQGLTLLHWVKVHHSMQAAPNFFAFNFKNKFLKRKNIRKALMYMWDSRYLTYVFQKYTFPASSFIPQGMLGFEKETQPSYFSVEKAQECLRKENSKEKITMTLLLIGNNELETNIITLYVNNLKKIGIFLKVQNVNPDEYNNRIASGNFDITYTGWIADYADTHSLIFPMFSKKLQETGMPTLATYTEKDLMPLVQEACTIADDNARSEIYKKINRYIRDEVLCIVTSHAAIDFFYNQSRISDVQVDILGNLNLRLLKKK